MPDAALKILDHGLVTALAAFVLIFGSYMGGSFLASRRRNRRLLHGLEKRFQRDYPDQVPDFETRNAWHSYLQAWDAIRSGLWGALWSGGVSCLVFLFVCFSPWPTMANFANLSTQPPLRVTFLMVDPSDEGFRFEGDVWNQSKDRLPVRASIILLDETGAQVSGATEPVAPLELGPRDRGQFAISLGAVPRAAAFTLRFLGRGDQELAYSKGFPETPETIVDKGRPVAKKRGRVGSR